MSKNNKKKNNKKSPQSQPNHHPPTRETDRFAQKPNVPSGQSSSSTAGKSASAPPTSEKVSVPRIQPEYINLEAHKHIQNYLRSQEKTALNQEDLNAVLRLSQHLRVFGLLSAVGYINQSNDQEGKVRERTVPVWHSLLGQLLQPEKTLETKELMDEVIDMSRNQSQQYLANWRLSIVLANHWNFWARAYKEEE